MRFRNTKSPVSEKDIAEIESALGINFPISVRGLYMSANGGSPEPYVFENENVDTVISEFLPLKSDNKGTALETYKSLVIDKKLVPPHFFPFAVDGGGDYFYVDCSSSDGVVYFYNSDSTRKPPLLCLNLGFSDFWSQLKLE